MIMIYKAVEQVIVIHNLSKLAVVVGQSNRSNRVHLTAAYVISVKVNKSCDFVKVISYNVE